MFYFRVPYEFWRVLHAEYGIVVYPSALTEEVDTHGLGVDVAYADVYGGHIGKSFMFFLKMCTGW